MLVHDNGKDCHAITACSFDREHSRGCASSHWKTVGSCCWNVETRCTVSNRTPRYKRCSHCTAMLPSRPSCCWSRERKSKKVPNHVSPAIRLLTYHPNVTLITLARNKVLQHKPLFSFCFSLPSSSPFSSSFSFPSLFDRCINTIFQSRGRYTPTSLCSWRMIPDLAPRFG